MIYTITFTGKSTFMKDAKNLKLKQLDAEGNVVSESNYKQSFLPGVGRSYCPRVRNGKVLIDMKQSELDELVNSLELYDSRGAKIEKAPINNPGAAFWKHEKLRMFIENSGVNLDDDDDFGKLWLAIFRADPHFQVGLSDDNPALDGVVKFRVVKTADAINDKNKEIDEVTKATEILHSMDFDRQVRVLRAMGVETKNPAPEAVKRTLMERITVQKDYKTNNGERYIEMFLRLANTKNSEINIRGIITKATNSQRRVIVKDKNKYYFGELPLGRTIDEVYNFLSEKENKDILDEISFKIGNSENSSEYEE